MFEIFGLNTIPVAVVQVLVSIVPFILIYAMSKRLWAEWLAYVREEFVAKEGKILLQIKIPRDITKTPQAMEVVLTGLHQTAGESTWIDRYWKGKTRNPFSLEIVSLSGQVYFFIQTRPSAKTQVESLIYAQYPNAEVVESDDYTDSFDLASGDFQMMGFELALTRPDPYPLKTYVEYGLDKPGDDEDTKVDPLTPLLEFMGGIEQDNNIFVQILIRAHKKEKTSYKDLVIWKPWTWFGKSVDDWKDDANAEVKKIKESVAPKDEEGNLDLTKPLNLTEGQKETIKALETSTSKYGFDVGVRLICIGKKEAFNPANIGGMIGGFKQFGSEFHNGFKPGFKTGFDYPWQDMRGKRAEGWKKKIFDAYKARGYFYKPWTFVGSGKLLPGGSYSREPFVLNTEELATIYHFPGQVAQTPSFQRLDSRKGEPPVNLPI